MWQEKWIGKSASYLNGKTQYVLALFVGFVIRGSDKLS